MDNTRSSLRQPGTGLSVPPYKPNFTMGGNAGPSAFDQEVGVRARAATTARRAGGADDYLRNAGGGTRTPSPATPAAPAPAAPAPAAVTAPAQPAGRAARLRSMVGDGARMTGGLAAGAGVASSFNDYKIDDPEVDSSLGGSVKALASGDLRGFASSVSKGALETGMDLGAAGAKAIDLVRPGTSQQYDAMLRNQFGPLLKGPAAQDPGAPADAAPTRPVPAAQPIVTASSSPALRDPTPTRRVSGGSSPLFTNLPEGSADSAALMGRGAISPQNMAAADALSARYATQPQAEAPGGAAAAFIPKDTGGYGLLDRDRLRERSLRMDADQLKPGSRGALRAFYSRQEQQDKNESAERTAETSATTLRRGQDISAETDRRGQDMGLQGKLAPVRQAGVLRQMKAQVINAAGGDYGRAARIWAAQGGDPKDFLDAQASMDSSATSEQGRFTKARENTMKEFTVFGADNKPDEKASAESFDVVRQIFPGIESADEATRNTAMADAKEMQTIFLNARNQDKVGWDALKFWEPARPQLRSMPNARGGQTETLSGIGGMTTIGAGNGDTLLTLNGKTLNLGKLNERQLELLERAKTKGWGQ